MAEGKAPRRKKHRNSKLGCATCKRRRVKCSEDLPECSNCAKHNSRCEYLDYSEKQLADFRRIKAEQQKQKDSATVSTDAATSLESLSLSSSSSKKTRKKAPKSRKSEAGDLSSHADRHNEPIRGLDKHNSFSSTSGSGSRVPNTESHADLQPTGPVPSNSSAETHLHSHLDPLLERMPGGFIEHLPHGFINQEQVALPTTKDPQERLSVLGDGHATGFTQDFDNLLSTQDQEIIYPVYSSNAGATSGFDPSEEPHFESLSMFESQPPDPNPVSGAGTALPNAVPSQQQFEILKCPSIIGVNYSARLLETVRELGPLIAHGLANLIQIRNLYHDWLGFFLHSAYKSKIMFSCLLNLTTNYLISNVFSGMDQERLDARFQVRNFRNSLITHSIQHYAVAIRELRSFLNFNNVPELAASVSYILSLMSMYDPEATINSTICFRDGMFSVLSYSLHIAKKNHIAPPPLVPIHLQLVGNISRTIYLPAYDPEFLIEFEHMLIRLGHLFSRVSTSVTKTSTFDFIAQKFEEFRSICHDTNTTYIPMANSNLRDLHRQTEVTFTLFYRWTKFNPTRLLVTRSSTDPLEKLLNIYVILFRKAVYAILPQGKFIYLRDLNSPLMLDVYNTFDDLEFYKGLDNPAHVCIDRSVYQQSLTEIKTLAAYAVRVHRFINIRTQHLYTSLVYNDKVRQLYPIKNIVDWRLSLTDIHATRKEFSERIGLVETMIKSFNTTYISAHHYPRLMSSDETRNSLPEEPTPLNMSSEPSVDILSLDGRGLLSKDHLPPLAL